MKRFVISLLIGATFSISLFAYTYSSKETSQWKSIGIPKVHIHNWMDSGFTYQEAKNG